jgi:hypothetical protein
MINYIKKNRITKISFFFIYTIAVLEIASRVFLSVDPIFVRVLDYDSTSERLRWVRRQTGSQTKILFEFNVYSPTLGWTMRPNLKDKTVYRNKTLSTNSRGLRGQVNYAYEKPADKTRILILGDSFTFGDEVSDAQTYPSYLQQSMPEAEVINFGITGYGHDQMLIYLKEEGIKYNPDIVILGFVHHDNFRNTLEFKDYAKPKFELAGDRLNLTNTPVLPPQAILNQEFFRLKFVDLLAILKHKLLWIFGPNQVKMQQLTTAILDEMVHVIRDSGAKPVFVYLPVELGRPQEEEFFSGYCINQREVQCFSLRPYFVANVDREEDIKAYVGHWNAKGNQLAAQGIKEYLLEHILADMQ